jgi:hypothetical protein
LYPTDWAQWPQIIVVVPFAAFACFGMPHYINSHSENVSMFAVKEFISARFKAELTNGIF